MTVKGYRKTTDAFVPIRAVYELKLCLRVCGRIGPR